MTVAAVLLGFIAGLVFCTVSSVFSDDPNDLTDPRKNPSACPQCRLCRFYGTDGCRVR